MPDDTRAHHFQPPHDRPCAGGATVWLTGLPSAGKSTIANAVAARLRVERCGVEVLDGDLIRENLSRGLGYSREDRAVNIRRIGFVAELLARNGVIVLVAAIAPHADVREQVRTTHAEAGTPYHEVYVSTPVEVAGERDVKGLYARQRAGEVQGLTGVDDPYEVPERPDLEIPSHEQSVDESVELLVDHLHRHGLTEQGATAPETATSTRTAP
ncbi:adenylyl-sulfate kinase [Actinomycetospora flava]|uniref:Adenylyl-sulfate kinase n=1 Tax=Actinomycetospora flava TaxID=3129232 RepID=A0ABU8M2N8_9PSEU